jgi:hypothetical protein
MPTTTVSPAVGEVPQMLTAHLPGGRPPITEGPVQSRSDFTRRIPAAITPLPPRRAANTAAGRWPTAWVSSALSASRGCSSPEFGEGAGYTTDK